MVAMKKFVFWKVTPSGNKAECEGCMFYRNYATIQTGRLYLPVSLIINGKWA